MTYTEKVTFKRDTVNKKGKLINTVRVKGLSVNSEFKDNEKIILISEKDFNQLENDLINSTEKIRSLENEILTIKDSNTDTPKQTSTIIELQEEINNRNQLLFNTQNTINSIINESVINYNDLNNNVVKSNEETKANIIELISQLQSDIKNILEYPRELDHQVNTINSSIDNTSWFKWVRSKNKFKIILDIDKLRELEAKLIEFTSQDIVQLANKLITPVELPASNLDKLTSNDLDLRDLYISIGSGINENDIIINAPDSETKE